ncbi:hypothetical protein CSOJ01_12100 [Colletotrichum sojae]|uniref:Uncharacterized protein n=1 Tax=Colletotrichum sojae TaxID=2175907 RepID=A0A8H6IVP3_9PEZI|nr:hypothetical protein CSOJ01_12100 [Colletotrichum sojae]
MIEELQVLEGSELTTAERNAAEEIGVRWNREDFHKEAKENPYDWDTVEHWYWELDNICPEFSEPWPEGLNRVSELP